MEGKMIRINAPYLEKSLKGTRVCAEVIYDGRSETYWIEVNEEYSGYLTDDRLDAFVVAFLYKAMNTKADIICEAPVTERLLNQLNENLIPNLSENMESFHRICVTAEAAAPVSFCEGAAATGWTGGVDCSWTLHEYLDAKEPEQRLTHLLIANNGAMESDFNEELLERLVKKAEDGIAKETQLKVIGVNTNLEKIPEENYLAVAGYRLPAVVLALQPLFSVFYHSAGFPDAYFSYDADNSAFYETVLMDNFSTDTIRFYSSGHEISRLQKLEVLKDDPYAQRYLHPCRFALPSINCTECDKCIKTAAVLYGLGVLPKFGQVFDLDKFEKNKDQIIADMIHHRNTLNSGQTYLLLKEKGLITKRAEEIAKIRDAVKKVVNRNREELSEKLNPPAGES